MRRVTGRLLAHLEARAWRRWTETCASARRAAADAALAEVRARGEAAAARDAQLRARRALGAWATGEARRRLFRAWATWLRGAAHAADVWRSQTRACRVAARAARRMVRAPLVRAWTTWARAAAVATRAAVMAKAQLVTQGAAMGRVTRMLLMVVRRRALISWRLAVRQIQFALLGEVRRTETHRARMERRALQRRYRTLAWRLVLRWKASRLLDHAWRVWWSATEGLRTVEQGRRRLACSTVRRAFGRWAAACAALERRAALLVRTLSLATRGNCIKLMRAFTIWRHVYRAIGSDASRALGVALGRHAARGGRHMALYRALGTWRACALRSNYLTLAVRAARERAVRMAWDRWVLQVDVVRELTRLEESVALLAVGRLDCCPRRSLLR